MKRIKTKDVLQRVKVNAIPPSPVGLVLVRISLDVIPGEDRVAVLDADLVEKKLSYL